MRKPFKLLRIAAVEVADTLGMVLDEPCSVASEGYEFERYAFGISCRAAHFTLSISADDIDEHFSDGAP